MKKVLVFPCGSEIGLELHRSLQWSTHFSLVGASSIEDHGMYVYENYINNVAQVDDKSFVKNINEIVAENNIDFIFPAHDSVVLALAEAVEKGDLACPVITSPYETCALTRSKKQSYEYLKDIITVPSVYSAEELMSENFPVFVKPDVGQGSKGACKISNMNDLQYHLSVNPGLLVLELLPGNEYTVDCFTDRKGNLKVCEGRQRNRTSNGISVNSSPVNDQRFLEIATRINDSIKFRGVWFYQVKENQLGELSLLEISPRIAGTMGLLRARGVNLALMSLFDAMDMPVESMINEYDITIDRALENKYRIKMAYEHVYIDFDDVVIRDNVVNPQVITLLFQCLNSGVALHLVTRHGGNLYQRIKELRLESLFDEICWLQKGEKKSSVITEDNAIFIDDSFLERKEVALTKSIPVFDTHMIEALLK